MNSHQSLNERLSLFEESTCTILRVKWKKNTIKKIMLMCFMRTRWVLSQINNKSPHSNNPHKRSKKPCKFGRDCKDGEKCRYSHTPPAVANKPGEAKDAPAWDWNDVVMEIQEYVPHDVRVPVEAVMAIVGPDMTDKIMSGHGKPISFFLKNPTVFECLYHPRLDSVSNHRYSNLWVRRINGFSPAAHYPDYEMPPSLILGLAYALPRNFISEEIARDGLVDVVPGLKGIKISLHAVCSLFPKLFDVYMPVDKRESPRVRSLVSTFESTGRDVPYEQIEKGLHVLYEAVRMAGPGGAAIETLVSPHTDLILRLYPSLLDFVRAHPVYFEVTTKTSIVKRVTRVDPVIPTFMRFPRSAAVARWTASAREEDIAAASDTLSTVGWKKRLAKTATSGLAKKQEWARPILEEKEIGFVTTELAEGVRDRIYALLPSDKEAAPLEMVALFATLDPLDKAIAVSYAKTMKGFLRQYRDFFTVRALDCSETNHTNAYVVSRCHTDAGEAAPNPYYNEDFMLETFKATINRVARGNSFKNVSAVAMALPEEARALMKEYYGGLKKYILHRPEHFTLHQVDGAQTQWFVAIVQPPDGTV